jgi:OOP family OmpA-OmpF porin
MHTRKVLAAFAAVFLTAAHADESAPYLGVSVGEASQSADGFDGSDTSFKLLGGYSFNKYLAAEAGYVDGGTQKDTIGALDVKASSHGYFAAVLAKLPLGNVVAPYAKLGYVVYDSTTTASSGGARFSESFHDDDLLYGIGCEFHLGKSFRLRAEYEQIDVPDADFEIISVVATFQF